MIKTQSRRLISKPILWMAKANSPKTIAQILLLPFKWDDNLCTTDRSVNFIYSTLEWTGLRVGCHLRSCERPVKCHHVCANTRNSIKDNQPLQRSFTNRQTDHQSPTKSKKRGDTTSRVEFTSLLAFNQLMILVSTPQTHTKVPPYQFRIELNINKAHA